MAKEFLPTLILYAVADRYGGTISTLALDETTKIVPKCNEQIKNTNISNDDFYITRYS